VQVLVLLEGLLGPGLLGVLLLLVTQCILDVRHHLGDLLNRRDARERLRVLRPLDEP
jgi:hypothetical protein